MDEIVTVNIKTPTNEIWEGSVLPLDYNFQMVIDELIDGFDLPRLDESAHPIAYGLRSVQQGRTIANRETVMSAQIRNGDMLEFQILGTAAPNPEPPFTSPPPYSGNNHYSSESGAQSYSSGGHNTLPPTILMPNTSEINIVLTLMDLNHSETISVPINRPVGEIIRQIAANYNLEVRDKTNQPIDYRLYSKALGDFLNKDKTLFEAQIPSLDRLTLHRKEVAG